MATVVNASPHGAADPATLAAFEARIGAAPPADYRRFLLAHNGGRFSPDEIILPGRAERYATVRSVFGLHGGPNGLSEVLRLVHDVIPAELLAFGEDVGGDLLCIGVRGHHYGRVYYWDHEHSRPDDAEPGWDNITLLAGSFNAFVDALGDVQPRE